MNTPTPTAPAPASKPGAAKFSVWGLAEALGVVACICSVAAFAGELTWLLELTTHFRLQYLVILAGLAALMAVGKRGRMAGVFGAFGVMNFVVLAPWLLPSSAPKPAAAPFRVMVLNVNTANPHHARVLAEIERVSPDALLLMEVDARWLEALRGLTNSLPHAILAPREDNFGIALFSRHPLGTNIAVEIGEAGLPSVATTMDVNGRRLFFIGTHPLPPNNGEAAGLRNEQLAKLAALVTGQKLPTVLAGDLNATPWSPHFRKLERAASLLDTGRGKGWRPTWPTWFPPLWISLDHCLVSPEIAVASRSIGKAVGSDHFPVVVELVLPAP